MIFTFTTGFLNIDSVLWARKICLKQFRELYICVPFPEKHYLKLVFFPHTRFSNKNTSPTSWISLHLDRSSGSASAAWVYVYFLMHLCTRGMFASPKNYMTFLLFFGIPLEHQNLWSWKFWFLKTNNVIILVILVSGARYQDMDMSDMSQTCQYWIWNKIWNFHKRWIAYWPMEKKALASEHFVKVEIETFGLWIRIRIIVSSI